MLANHIKHIYIYNLGLSNGLVLKVFLKMVRDSELKGDTRTGSREAGNSSLVSFLSRSCLFLFCPAVVVCFSVLCKEGENRAIQL